MTVSNNVYTHWGLQVHMLSFQMGVCVECTSCLWTIGGNALCVCELLEGMHFLLVVWELLNLELERQEQQQTVIDVHNRMLWESGRHEVAKI
jgi:hypothetical protein